MICNNLTEYQQKAKLLIGAGSLQQAIVASYTKDADRYERLVFGTEEQWRRR